MISMKSALSGARTGAVAVLLALAVSAPAPAATTPTDAWITVKVKLALATTEGVRATEVNVDTVGRRVTLHGIVNTAAEQNQAATTAKAVEGVLEVRNLLQVVPAKHEEAVEEKDEEISARVKAALAETPSLKDGTIAVQSVNKGVVLLGGTAETMSELLTALLVTGEVKGVRRIASEVQTQDAVADARMWKERNMAVGGTNTRTARSAANDLYITSMVKMRLLADSATPAMEINVDTRDGVVTLFGIVDTAEAKAAAEANTKKTDGVISVKNQIQVVTAAKQPAVEAKDEVIGEQVRKNLADRPDLGSITVEVKNCLVRLTGTVPSGIERVEAMQIARATKGVCAVKDDLTFP